MRLNLGQGRIRPGSALLLLAIGFIVGLAIGREQEQGAWSARAGSWSEFCRARKIGRKTSSGDRGIPRENGMCLRRS
jgi:hypothetical protein